MNFNKEQLSVLLEQAKGKRTLNQFARECDVSNSYLSNLIQCKKENPPSIEVAQKIASKSHNNITLDLLLVACGYSDVNLTIDERNLIDYWKDRAISAETRCEKLIIKLTELQRKLDKIANIVTPTPHD